MANMLPARTPVKFRADIYTTGANCKKVANAGEAGNVVFQSGDHVLVKLLSGNEVTAPFDLLEIEPVATYLEPGTRVKTTADYWSWDHSKLLVRSGESGVVIAKYFRMSQILFDRPDRVNGAWKSGVLNVANSHLAIIPGPAVAGGVDPATTGHSSECLQRSERYNAFFEKYPFACPICNGRGLLPAPSNGEFIQCPNCYSFGSCPRCSENLNESKTLCYQIYNDGRVAGCGWNIRLRADNLFENINENLEVERGALPPAPGCSCDPKRPAAIALKMVDRRWRFA